MKLLLSVDKLLPLKQKNKQYKKLVQVHSVTFKGTISNIQKLQKVNKDRVKKKQFGQFSKGK